MPESMSPTVEFTSVAKEFRHEYIVDKSRFITTIYPCTTEEEAQLHRSHQQRVLGCHS